MLFKDIENVGLSKQPLRTYQRQKPEVLNTISIKDTSCLLSTQLPVSLKRCCFEAFDLNDQHKFFSFPAKSCTLLQKNNASKFNFFRKMPRYSKKKPFATKSKLTQLCLDLLPSRITCPDCGMSYTRGSADDDIVHLKFHAESIEGIDYPLTSSIKEVWRENFTSNKIIMVTMSSSYREIKKAKEILNTVDLELGSTSPFPNSIIQYSSLINQYKFFLYLKEKKCIGLILVEPIRSAYPVCPSPSQSSSITLESKALSTYIMGVSRIWVCKTYRRKRIATKLLDIACDYFVYGIKIKKHEVAFSQPSESGKLFIENWTGGKFSVYLEKVVQRVMHPRVQKIIILHKNYLVHDEDSICEKGDVVKIEACRPLSARKRFSVAQILQKAKIPQNIIDQANQQVHINNELNIKSVYKEKVS
ncbi:hypothetical protein PMAC_003291 [Pneumocystis sp. 'macacae']|nr:hypothetical protein PMAC_003291 [Pneumocystis sp. 'macacae']